MEGLEQQKEFNEAERAPSLLGMFSSPGMQFERIKNQPKIWLPLLVVTLLYGLGTFLMINSLDSDILIDQGIPEDEIGIFMGFLKATAVITGILTPAFTVLVSSAILLAITKIASSKVTFKQLFSMNTYILVVSSAGLILNMAIRALIGGDPEIYVTSLAWALNQGQSEVLGQFEIFSIWSTILTAIGLHRTALLSKGAAWIIAAAFFVLGLIFSLVSV
jgi:hypothetical protein